MQLLYHARNSHTDIAPWSEDVILLCNVLCCNNSAEALFVLKCSVHIGVVGVSNFLNVFIRQFTQLPRDHSVELPCVDE